MRRWMIAPLVAVAMALVFLPAWSASAHPAGTTGLLVTIQSDAVEITMQIQEAGFTAATGYEVTDQAALDAVADNLMTFILHRVSVADGVSTLTPTVVASPELVPVNGENAIATTVRFADPGRSIEGAITLDYSFILDVVPAHQVYVALVSDWNNGQIAEGDPEVVAVLGGGVTEVTLDRSSPAPANGFFSVIWLGMLHIAEGTDHLLFLSTLLVVAPSLASRAKRGYRWNQPIPLKKTIGRAALIISCFTVGHLVTLALVSLGLISFPTKPVEILVAVSIIVAAIHAIRPIVPRGELLIAGLFGLVHGTAFATTILDLNLGFGEKILAILGFNVGVELAQLIAAVLVLPLLILLSHARVFGGFRTVIAGIAIIAAAAWIVGISTDQNSALQPVFDQIARFPIAFYLALVVIVVGLWYFARTRRPENASAEKSRTEVLQP